MVDRFLHIARGRLLALRALQYAAWALSFAAAGFLLLLLFGTQWLSWYMPLVFAVCGLVVAYVRDKHRGVTDYQLLQQVDRELNLSDRLSTLFYFRQRQPSSPMLSVIEEQCGPVSPIDVRRAVPVTWPQAGWVALTLVLACVATGILRMSILHSLDFERPLASFELPAFSDPAPVAQAASQKSEIQEYLEAQLQQMGTSDEVMQAPDPVPGKPEFEDPSAIPVGENEVAAGQEGQSMGERGSASDVESKSTPEGNADASAPGGGEKEAAADPSKNARPEANQSAKGKPGDRDTNLMSKMRDALANMLNKLKPDAPEQGQQEDASAGMTPAQQASAAKGMPTKGNKGSEGQSADQRGESEAMGDKVPGMKADNSDRSPKRAGPDDAKSGMGKSDGSKDILDAEQMAAMGKISEIFGKRAAEISGEMKVEVPSGNQQIKTAYTNRAAIHNGNVSEANRDEIPLEYQAYVRRYYELIRKTPAPAKAAPAPAKPAAPADAAASQTRGTPADRSVGQPGYQASQ